jgi:hypothetical protein
LTSASTYVDEERGEMVEPRDLPSGRAAS